MKQTNRKNKKIIPSNTVDKLNKNQNNPKRFLKKEKNNKDIYIIDEEKIKEEEKYDGYYAQQI